MTKFDKLLEDKKILVMLSILVAFLAWFAVAIYVNSEIKTTVRLSIPIDNNSQALVNAGVETVVQNEVHSITVSVQGDRTVVGNLGTNDFVITPEFGNVTGPGKYQVNLLIEKRDTTKDFRILDADKYSVDVTLDYMAKKTLKVEPVVEGIAIKEGYIRGEVYASPGEITIRGPQSAVEKVQKCQVYIHDNVTLSDKKDYAREFAKDEVKLLDSDGNTVEKTNVTTEATTIMVTVPVLQKATLPLRVDFIGAPDSLDTSSLKYTLSHAQITVAALKDNLSKTTEISVGYYDLRNFKSGQKMTMKVQLPSGFIALENLTEVTLEFDSSYKSNKSVTVSNLNIVNKPDNVNVTLETEKLYNVQLAGDKGQLEQIGSSDVVGEIDLRDVDLSKGTISVAVTIKVPNHNGVWATGTYRATINVSGG